MTLGLNFVQCVRHLGYSYLGIFGVNANIIIFFVVYGIWYHLAAWKILLRVVSDLLTALDFF